MTTSVWLKLCNFFLDGIESIVGKGENAIASIFFLPHNVLKGLLPRGRQSMDCVVMG